MQNYLNTFWLNFALKTMKGKQIVILFFSFVFVYCHILCFHVLSWKMQAVIWRCTLFSCKNNFICKYKIDFVPIFAFAGCILCRYLCRNDSGACKKFFYALSACVCAEIVNWGGGCFCHRLMPAKHGRYKLCTLQATRGLQIQIQIQIQTTKTKQNQM